MRQMSHKSSFRPANLPIVGHWTFHYCLLYQGHFLESLGASSTPSVNHQSIPFLTLRLALFCLARKLSRGGGITGKLPNECAEAQGNQVQRPPTVTHTASDPPYR